MQRRRSSTWLARGAVLATLVLASACGSATGDVADTPGYSDQERTVDTSPFEPAGPSGSTGSSTIPDAVFEPDLIEPTLPQPDQSTTTTVLGELVDPEVAAVVDLCGFEEQVAPFQRLPSASPEEVEPLMASLVALMARYAEVAPSVLEADLLGIRETLLGLQDLLAMVGFDASSPAYLERLDELGREAESGAEDALGVRLQRVVSAERRLCI